MDQVILVNEFDVEIGTMEKMEAHQKGLLHRAFSVLIFNSAGELLLQQRSNTKYHSANLWTNTCCSHPRPGETIMEAANRRLKEEMGIEAKLKFTFSFIYNVVMDNGLVENELDHVFIGVSDSAPQPNQIEVNDWKYVTLDWLKHDITGNKDRYTAWFKILLEHKSFVKRLDSNLFPA